MKNFNKSEILAPVGNMDMMYAAIKGGCNAIYLGGKLFSARAFADNFSIEDIKNIVNYCHLNNVKVYVAVNILIHDYEIEEALNYVYDLYNIDVDALIIQDLGLASLIRKNLPDFDLHASTQINIYNEFGVKKLKDMGFKRVVLARETPYEEIKRIKENIDIELEVFIHGSLCVATSGQCLMSSYIGGRSGNRGKCAQPCRKNYLLYDKNFKLIDAEEKAYLSTRDLCTYENIEKLSEIGIDSLKIEGRMKKPEYVYTVVNEYKKRLEKISYDTNNLVEVSNRGFTRGLIFNDYGINFAEIERGNFSKGILVGEIEYINNKPSIVFLKDCIKGDILFIQNKKGKFYQITLTKDYSKGEVYNSQHIYDAKNKSEVRRVSSQRIKDNLSKALNKENKRNISMKFIGKVGELPQLYLYYKDKTFNVLGEDIISEAKNRPITDENILNQMSKIQDTNYILESIDIDIEDNMFLPLKSLNKLRRKAINQLDLYLINFNNRDEKEFNNNILYTNDDINEFMNIEDTKKLINIEIMDNKVIENIDLNLVNNIYIDNFDNIESLKNIDNLIIYKMPRFSTSNNLELLKLEIEKYKDIISGFLINNLGDIEYINRYFNDKLIIGDYGLNILNRHTLNYLTKQGISKATLSTELNLDEINDIKNLDMYNTELLISGSLTSMILLQCPFTVVKKCEDIKGCKSCRFAEGYYLKDEFGEFFKLRRLNNYTELFNSQKLETLGFIEEIKNTKVQEFRMILDEDKDASEIVEEYYRALNNLDYNKNKFKDNYTKGHYYRGIK